MSDGSAGVAHRIEDLAHHSGATVRTIRAYQDRGLLPRPERRGRANVYSDAHVARLRQIADLLGRGYTLASIKELLDAWDTGRGLGGILGLVAGFDRPWTGEETLRISRAELEERFGGGPGDAAVPDAVELGVLAPVPGEDDLFHVSSPQELSLAVQLHTAGVPLSAVAGRLRELREQVEHLTSRFLEFADEQVVTRHLDRHHPSDHAEATEAACVRRLRPLARQTVDVELARAMGAFTDRHREHDLGTGQSLEPAEGTCPVPIPVATMRAVEALVGPEHSAQFVTIAAEREVRARVLDSLTANRTKETEVTQIP
ncbi:MerR family transcriptional regulator [Streptomyces phyllanthi]|uniref:MerR family transcriptional regulator n=1 Tax=Streptomyces phyllanthi TaxID=1803180 RepID=A0A5N8VUB1_9ACTN|nr:MerR family transcriptional regulator [Streptomyces phyllanthi]MPY38861.1 MerR family transcriptional regulator [Streptomyces phyllanthi]